MKHLMIWLIGLYRKFISPHKPPCCRFTPTCSAYAVEAYSKRGFFVGTILTVWRILRCNPFSRGGYDPVPERGLRNPPERREQYYADLARKRCECDTAHTDTTEKEKETE